SSCADVWAIGTIAIESLGVKLFMPIGSVEEIAEKIAQNGPAKVVLEQIKTVLKNFGQISNGWPSRVEKDWGAISIPNFTKLTKSMVERRPEDRPIVESCLKDPFLIECNVKYERLELQMNHETRIQKIRKETLAEIERFGGSRSLLRILESDSRVARPTWNTTALARLSGDESPVFDKDDLLAPPAVSFTPTNSP
ncbi:unnamed protein product, partial [Mesorhabditis belari]